ncbi:FixG Ig-like domain-containing protein [Pararhodospirillum photometricum]|nr:FixG Ig-like domain-containing protein [Pararhodospirillum photometricum]
MRRYDLPEGLIAYDSQARIAARAAGRPEPRGWRRPRLLIYALVLGALATALAWSLATRARLDLTVLHERSPLFVTLADGSIRNAYTLKILNMARQDARFRLEVDGPLGARLETPDHPQPAQGPLEIAVGPARVGQFRVFVSLPRGTGDTEVTLILTDTATGQRLEAPSLFARP